MFKKDIIQVKNPKTNRYVKVDRGRGRIYEAKKSKGAYKGIPIYQTKEQYNDD